MYVQIKCPIYHLLDSCKYQDLLNYSSHITSVIYVVARYHFYKLVNLRICYLNPKYLSRVMEIISNILNWLNICVMNNGPPGVYIL